MNPVTAISTGHRLATRGRFMDRITDNLLKEFSALNALNGLPEDEQFEHFASYVTVRRHFAQTLDTFEITTGKGNDTGIDAIAILVNGQLVTDKEGFEEQFGNSDYLDVTFIFVQAERSASFDGSKIGNFAFGVQDFFRLTPSLPRNKAVSEAAEIMAAIYDRSGKFKRSNPSCRMYYVTTGRWLGDAHLEGRRAQAVQDLRETGNFGEVEFRPIGADDIQKLYNLTKNAVARDFLFNNRVEVPDVPGVSQAYLGYLPRSQFMPLITNDAGEIIRTIFYDNVRDWQDYNDVNDEMRQTLTSEKKSRFVLMNNGVTIIARSLTSAGSRFHVEDYQVVNGCQTSHVLFGQKDATDDTVLIPVRIIGTQDEDVIESIIRATNRQTEVKPEQFAAITDFAKKLEQFFEAFTPAQRLYYERRPCQYDRLEVEKTRIVTQPNMVRAFAAMFLEEPHRTIRSYKALTDRLGTEIYNKEHKLEPYYVAAFTLYKLEYLWRKNLDTRYKVARPQLLLAFRNLVTPRPVPHINSREIEKMCKELTDALWDSAKVDEIFVRAVEAVDHVAEGNLDRDNIHTQPFTEKLISYLRGAPNGGTKEGQG